MTPVGQPTVTVAIPLHRSAPFIEIVSRNIGLIADDNVEILVSDQTLLDDTLELLRERHGADPRVTFLRDAGVPDWVDHYNALLEHANGRYFMWMPHDDDFPPEYLPLLTAALDARPDALLAFGTIHAINLDGSPADEDLPPPPIPLGCLPCATEAMTLLERWNLGIPFRGVLRRDEILRRRLRIRHLRGDRFADRLWVFAVAASAPLVFEPACSCRKRFYLTSTHAQWRRGSVTEELEVGFVAARYLFAAQVAPSDIARLMRFVTVRAIHRALRALPGDVRKKSSKLRRSVSHRFSRAMLRHSGLSTPPTS